MFTFWFVCEASLIFIAKRGQRNSLGDQHLLLHERTMHPSKLENSIKSPTESD